MQYGTRTHNHPFGLYIFAVSILKERNGSRPRFERELCIMSALCCRVTPICKNGTSGGIRTHGGVLPRRIKSPVLSASQYTLVC